MCFKEGKDNICQPTHHWDKIPAAWNSEEACFCSWVQRLQSIVSHSQQKQHGRRAWQEAAQSPQEAESGEEPERKMPGIRQCPKSCPRDLLPQTRVHLPTAHSVVSSSVGKTLDEVSALTVQSLPGPLNPARLMTEIPQDRHGW